MAGRRPKPTALKILAGNPGHRPLNKNEPAFEPRLMSVPRFLDDEAKREWRRVVKELHEVGLLSGVDRAALAGYCQAWSRWVTAEKALQGKALTYKTESGYEGPNPLIAIAKAAATEMRRFMVEFGMTPASRSKVKASAPKEPDELEKLLFGTKDVKVRDEKNV